MALPTYVGAGTAASGFGALTPTIPTSSANDILILVVDNTYTTTTDATLSDAQGFAAIAGGAVNSGAYAGSIRSHQTLFWKRATGSDSDPTVADNGEHNVARIYAFGGCVTTGDPWDVISTTGDATGDDSISVSGATTTGSDRLVAVFVTAFTNNVASIASWANTDLANVTERDDTSYTVGSERVHIAVTTGEKATAGAYGATTATWSGGVYWVWAGITLALKPPVASTTTFYGNPTPLPQWQQRRNWRPRSLGAAPVFSPTNVAGQLASGTTLAALQAGSTSLKYVIAIEGYQYLLTDATPAQAVNAWQTAQATTHYSKALGPNIYVSIEHQQLLDWRKPFTRGGSMTLHVMPDENDTFGIDTHKRNAGQQTELHVTSDRDDSSLVVKSVTGLASSGDVWIGTECIGYSGTGIDGGTGFPALTGATRGKYAPLVNGNSGIGWSETHRVGQNALEVLLNPLVTSIPRTWAGKWISVYLHKYDASIGALNSKDDALLVFTGRIVSIGDDPATGATVVEAKHVLDCVAEATIGGRDQFSGKIRNTISLNTGMIFKMKDFQFPSGSNSAPRTANNLVVVESGAAGANQMNKGQYTAPELHAKINLWLTSETQAGRLYGKYSMGYGFKPDGVTHTDIYWTHNAASTTGVRFELGMPQQICNRLGYFPPDGSGTDAMAGGGSQSTYYVKKFHANGSGTYSELSPRPYMRVIFNSNTSVNQIGDRAIVDDVEGTFRDQYSFLPTGTQPILNSLITGGEWGLFIVDNRFLTVALVSTAGGVTYFDNFTATANQFGLEGTTGGNEYWFTPLRANDPEWTSVRQILIYEFPLADALKYIFLSTGTVDYNHITWDSLPNGIGIGIPGQIFDATSLLTIDNLPHADKPILLVVDRQTKLADALAGELILRRAFLRWKSGRLEFATWKSPHEANSVGTLTEANKAAPAGVIDHHRSVTVENGGWAAPTVKIQYNRTLTGNVDGDTVYRDNLVIADKTALDDMGGDGPVLTFSARGTMGDFHSSGSTVGSLSAGFMASMPLFSRPARQSSRSIDQRYFEGYSIGDIMLTTDAYARDPDTGRRGVATRPGIITRHSYSLGGFQANSDEAQGQTGTVDLFYLDVNRVAAYVPCAQVDDTAANGGYDSGTNTLTLYPNKCSETSDSDLAYFSAGDKIRVIEIDPADPAAPLSWDQTISTVVGNTFTGINLDDEPTWDATKKYRVVFDDYSDAAATQQTKTFQADSADVLIQDTRAPFEYGIGGQLNFTTAWSATDPVELPPNASFGDGVGRDVGHEIALMRLANNLYNYKTGVSTPWLSNQVHNTSGSVNFGTNTWYCVQCRPIHLGDDVLLSSAYRVVSVAPWFRAGTAATASVRVTLSKTPPTDTDWFDVDRGSVYSDVTFTTSSTTWQTPTAQTLDARVKGIDGTAWIYVEVNANCETRGLAYVQEGPLVY